MKFIVAGAAGLLLAFGAHGADLNLSWTNASTNVDGSAIPTDITDISSLKTTELEYGSCGVADIPTGTLTTVIRTTTVPGKAETTTITVTPGTWCVHARHQNLGNVYSDWSVSKSKTVLETPNTPNPPGGLTVTEMVAYTLVKQSNRFVLLPVGTVPGGTLCDSSQTVNGYFVVPTEAVTWSGTIRPVVVVAKCG